FQLVADVINEARAELQRDFSGHTLFAYGGNGGLFGCGVAERANINSVYLLNLGPVFSAFGSSVSDISHVYERALYLASLDEAGLGHIHAALDDMKAEGEKDLLGEGLRPSEATHSVELEVARDGAGSLSVATTDADLRSAEALKSRIATA